MTGIKRSNKQILPMVIGSTLVLGLIWLNTFIHQNSFSDSYGDFSFLIEIIPAVSLATLLNTLVMFRSAVWQSTYSTADCAQDAAWGAIAMMALLFKVVIIPFCNWSLDHQSNQTNFVWCRTHEEPFSRIPVSCSEALHSPNDISTIFGSSSGSRSR